MADALAQSLEMQLIAPERVLASRRAVMVTLPGATGQLGVLAGHAPLVTLLQPGIVTVEGNDDANGGTSVTVQRFFVSGGFAEIAEAVNDGAPTQLTILADEALPMDELQSGDVASEIAQLEGQLADTISAAERTAVLQRLSIATAKLAALQSAA